MRENPQASSIDVLCKVGHNFLGSLSHPRIAPAPRTRVFSRRKLLTSMISKTPATDYWSSSEASCSFAWWRLYELFSSQALFLLVLQKLPKSLSLRGASRQKLSWRDAYVILRHRLAPAVSSQLKVSLLILGAAWSTVFENHFKNIVRILKTLVLKCNATTNDGMTPFVIACKNGRKNVAKHQ